MYVVKHFMAVQLMIIETQRYIKGQHQFTLKKFRTTRSDCQMVHFSKHKYTNWGLMGHFVSEQNERSGLRRIGHAKLWNAETAYDDYFLISRNVKCRCVACKTSLLSHFQRCVTRDSDSSRIRVFGIRNRRTRGWVRTRRLSTRILQLKICHVSSHDCKLVAHVSCLGIYWCDLRST
jgi:hypothetical protein